jgi:hypothetical protein
LLLQAPSVDSSGNRRASHGAPFAPTGGAGAPITLRGSPERCPVSDPVGKSGCCSTWGSTRRSRSGAGARESSVAARPEASEPLFTSQRLRVDDDHLAAVASSIQGGAGRKTGRRDGAVVRGPRPGLVRLAAHDAYRRGDRRRRAAPLMPALPWGRRATRTPVAGEPADGWSRPAPASPRTARSA